MCYVRWLLWLIASSNRVGTGWYPGIDDSSLSLKRGYTGERAGAGALQGQPVFTGSGAHKAAMSETNKETLVKRFSGDGADPQKEYKRWKRWSRAYLTVQRAKGTPETAMGSLLFTLLDGSALRAFDATNMDDLEVDGGQDVIYQVLDDRYPEESSHDRLGEILDAIFDLKVERGESTAVYTGKARAAFSAAEAEGVKFPDTARGYLVLRFARLPLDKKAIVLAAARGSYNENDISAALRTTFPDHLYAGRHAGSNVNVMEGEYDQVETYSEGEQQVLLAEEGDPEELGEEPIEEQDAVDILMTWKQTRTNINKEKIARGLSGQRDVKKLEARVRCFKCKQVGHFSRNCPRRGGKGSAGPASSGSGSTRASYVMMVKDEKMETDDETNVHEVVSIWNGCPKDFWQSRGKKVIRHHVLPRTQMFNARWTGCPVRYDQLQDRRTTHMQLMTGEEKVVEDDYTFLMEESSRRTAEEWIGKTVFYLKDEEDEAPDDWETNEIVQAFVAATKSQQVWQSMDEEVEPASSDEEQEETPCQLLHPAGWGVVDTGCGRGVIGENTLKRHENQLQRYDMKIMELEPRPHRFRYGNGSMDVSHRRVQIPIMLAGKELRMRVHVVPGEVPLLISKRFLKGLGSQMDLQNNKLHFAKAGITVNLIEKEDNSYQLDLLDCGEEKKLRSPEVDVLVSQEVQGNEEDQVKVVEQEMSNEGAALGSVEDATWDGTIEYSGEDTEEETDVRCVFKAKERKDLQQQLSEVLRMKDDERHSIVEVFSPGRFAELAQDFGFESMGVYDLSLDWDWNKVVHRRRLEEKLALSPPDILVMTPPCGPWSRLQQCTPEEKRVDPEAFQREVEKAQSMVKWCLKMAERQLALGLHYLFESSQTSRAWSMPEMKKFQDWWKHPSVDVAACAVGLKDKESDKLFGKKWKFMTSSPAVATMLEPLVCDRSHEHQVVEGSSGGVMRSIQTQVYPKRLVRKILGGFRMHEITEDHCCAISQETIQVTGALKGEGRRRVETAIRKMHVNLGHASTDDLHRILRHHGASAEVLELVKAFKCDVCESHKAPKAVKDSAPPRDLAPLRYIGLDVKWLPTWKKDYKIKALNIVRRASGLQQMFPFRENEQECSELIARLYRMWTRSFGRPKFCKFDASRCNLGQAFLDVLERDGTTAIDIPGEAHEQMGDVEAQGRHFEGMLTKVIHEMGPTNYLEWVECVDATVEARNMLMKRNGYSSYQLVFGRDPEFPGDDLLSDKPNEIANGAILEDAIAEYTFKARSIARQQVLEALDHKAARIALNSRPRPQREFRPGDEVAVWRRGRGIKKSTARWRGPGIVAGLAGGNIWVSMPGAFIKCSPEQLRLRTTEEREADRFLVRDLRAAAASLYPEVGFSGRSQKCFVDITQDDRPPGDLLTPEMVHVPDSNVQAESGTAEGVPIPHVPEQRSNQGSESASRRGSDSTSNPRPPSSYRESISSMDRSVRHQWEQSVADADRLDGHMLNRSVADMEVHTPPELQEPEPKRMRAEPSDSQQIGGQHFPPSLPVPPQQQQNQRNATVDVSSSSGGSQRSVQMVGDQYSVNAVYACQSELITATDSTASAICLSVHPLEEDDSADFVLGCDGDSDEVLLAGGRNEINLKDPKWSEQLWKQQLMAGIQKEVDNVVHTKQALRALSLQESRQARQQFADRVIPSRLVLTPKVDESGQDIVKARWTARGDKDPDLFSLIREGKTQAPTISSNGRFTVLQLIASYQFKMQLGDVTGAFLEADNMVRAEGKLFMAMPTTYPLPGYDKEQLFEVIRPIYGLNDSPQNWFNKFRQTVKGQGWIQSKLDPCVFFLWQGEQLAGVMGVHVDDVVIGGEGPLFDQKLKVLRSTFPFRKWQEGQGTFCGSLLQQHPATGGISVSQREFIEKMQKPKLRTKDPVTMEVNDEEVTSLKSCLGAALWLARETRPDLSVQVSQGQQLMPRPTLGEAKTVGNVVRRAKQYQELEWRILPIPVKNLRLCLHTDASFGNAKGKGTQAGYIVGVTEESLQKGEQAMWSPAAWRSYRLKRVVGSTFAGESQALMDGLGHAEWIGCHLAEGIFSDFSLQERSRFLKSFALQAIVDCKSVYDHLQQYASPGSVSDKRVAIDLVIIRETIQRIHGVIRWCPTWLQLADALTKESPEAMDLLRGALMKNQYHLHAESSMMAAAAEQKQRRIAKRHVSEGLSGTQTSTVFSVSSRPLSRPMVRVSARGFKEEEIRALFECMVSSFAKSGKDYDMHMSQTKALCKVKIPASLVNTKEMRGETTLVTYSFCKSTNMVTVNATAVLIDKAEDMLVKVFLAYGQLIHENQVTPLPVGAQQWGKAFQMVQEQGPTSLYLRGLENGAIGTTATVSSEMQTHLPKEEEFSAAVADLCQDGARRLHNYPLWKQRFLQFLLQEYGADPDQVMALSGIPTEFKMDAFDDAWDVDPTPIQDLNPKAKVKPEPDAKSNGYRY